MKAADVKYSLERTVNPKTQSPGAGFFNSIAGFDAMAEGKAETLSGIEVLDDYTVKITLSAPNATFLHVMAINFASVVPREEAEKWGADFGKHPVGTGAFTLADWRWARSWCSRRIRTTTRPASRVWTASPSRSARAHGRPAAPGEGRGRHRRRRRAAGKFLQFRKDPKYKDLLVVGDQRTAT